MTWLRARWLDAVLLLLAAAVVVGALAEPLVVVRLGSAVSAVGVVCFLGRRRGPLAPALGFVLLAAGVYEAHRSPTLVFLAVLVCFAASGALPSRRGAVTVWLVGCLSLLAAMLADPAVQGWSDILLTLTFCTVMWGAGLLVAERSRSAGRAQSRVALVEERREYDMAAAAAHERARIGAELHDIVSHGLSIVILQTVAARVALADAPDEPAAVERRLEAVETTARSALDDMRRLLTLLRADDIEAAGGPAATLAPAVGLAQLPALVEQVRAAGLPVELAGVGAGPDLPPGLDAAAYRIVQEALTNVIRHAPGAPTAVRVLREPRALEVSVRNAAGSGAPSTSGPKGSGFGLVGMRQRAELYGGELQVGPQAGGYLVAARFPVGGAP